METFYWKGIEGEGWAGGAAKPPRVRMPVIMVNSTGCPCRRHGFSSHHPHGDSQLSVPPAPTDPTSSSDLWGYQVGTRCTHIYADKYSYT